MAFSVSACGGTSFKDAANAACADRAKTIRAEIQTPRAAGDTTRFQRMIDATATEFASLQALEPPLEQQASYRSLLLELARHLQGTRDIMAAAARGDPVAVQAAIARTGEAAAGATFHGRQLGLSSCDWVT
jgi:hypothetical protein